MPKIDGWQAIKLLKKDKRTNDIPIIIVDNMCQKEDVEKGLRAGASRFICTANYSSAELIEFFKDFLKKHKAKEIYEGENQEK